MKKVSDKLQVNSLCAVTSMFCSCLCFRLKHIGIIYGYLKTRLPENCVEMYHRKTSEKKQTEICELFTKLSDLKVVVCSSSFSMG